MSRRAARLARLEAGPAGEGTKAAWAARYGWPQLYEWDNLFARRIRAKLLPILGIESDPTPEETELERQYHRDMAIQFPPDPHALAQLRHKLGMQP
jgi:hypothetical protein